MKTIYVVICTVGDSGFRFAYIEPIKAGENILAYVPKNADICHLCETKAEAEKIAAAWNQEFDKPRKKELRLYAIAGEQTYSEQWLTEAEAAHIAQQFGYVVLPK